MATRDQPSFARMARTFPVRTGLFTLGPFAIGVAQLLNGIVHGTALLPVVTIAVVMVAFSVMVTRIHLAAFRRQSLSPDFD
jgi:hypothetical protein